jgi:hypothetical protein
MPPKHTLALPVPPELLTASLLIDVTFPDTGGTVASAILQVNRLEDAPGTGDNR